MTVGILENFVRVSAAMPCPICAKPDWCLVSHDGMLAICSRIESAWKHGDAGHAHELTEPVEVNTAEQLSVKLDTDTVEALAMKWKYAMDGGTYVRLGYHLGVSADSLRSLCVGAKYKDGELSCYTFPMVNADERICGVRFRFPNGDKRSLKGGTDGVFINILRTEYGIPDQPRQTVYILEGATDAAAFLSERLDVIGRPNCTGGGGIITALIDKWDVADVVVVSDNDEPGYKGARNLAIRLERELGLYVPIIAPTQHKDARQCIINGGSKPYIEQAVAGKSNEFWKEL